MASDYTNFICKHFEFTSNSFKVVIKPSQTVLRSSSNSGRATWLKATMLRLGEVKKPNLVEIKKEDSHCRSSYWTFGWIVLSMANA